MKLELILVFSLVLVGTALSMNLKQSASGEMKGLVKSVLSAGCPSYVPGCSNAVDKHTDAGADIVDNVVRQIACQLCRAKCKGKWYCKWGCDKLCKVVEQFAKFETDNSDTCLSCQTRISIGKQIFDAHTLSKLVQSLSAACQEADCSEYLEQNGGEMIGNAIRELPQFEVCQAAGHC